MPSLQASLGRVLNLQIYNFFSETPKKIPSSPAPPSPVLPMFSQVIPIWIRYKSDMDPMYISESYRRHIGIISESYRNHGEGYTKHLRTECCDWRTVIDYVWCAMCELVFRRRKIIVIFLCSFKKILYICKFYTGAIRGGLIGHWSIPTHYESVRRTLCDCINN